MKSNTYIYKKCEKKVHVFAQQIFHSESEIQMNIQKIKNAPWFMTKAH